LYRIITYSNSYPDLNDALIVSNLKLNICNVIENVLLRRKLLAKVILEMKKLNPLIIKVQEVFLMIRMKY
jgi:hypothetical protein